MPTDATTPCEWCGAAVTPPGKPCSVLSEAELRALRAAIAAGAPIDAACVQALRERGIVPSA